VGLLAGGRGRGSGSGPQQIGIARLEGGEHSGHVRPDPGSLGVELEDPNARNNHGALSCGRNPASAESSKSARVQKTVILSW
jgi:hypothetical protein